MAKETGKETIVRYLKDLLAAERNFETQLTTFSKQGDDPTVQQLFSNHAKETKAQCEKLTKRLEQLGEKPGVNTAFKSFIAHLAGMGPKMAQIGQYEEEVSIQNLIMAYAVENSEVAAYESLALAAIEANDSETEALAREIQAEEERTAEKVWNMLSACTRKAFSKVAGSGYESQHTAA